MSTRHQRGHLDGRGVTPAHRITGLALILVVLLTGCTVNVAGQSRAADAYVDPQGSYTLIVARTWSPVPSPGDSAKEEWSLPGSVDGTPVSLYLDTLPFEGRQDMIMFLYGFQQMLLDGDIEDLRINSAEVVTGSSGDVLGVVDYSATTNGADIQVLQVIAVGGGEQVSATLIASPSSFFAVIPSVRSALLSLHKI